MAQGGPFYMIYASLIQTKGPEEGIHFDSVTMEPLIFEPAMREALRVFRKVMPVLVLCSPQAGTPKVVRDAHRKQGCSFKDSPRDRQPPTANRRHRPSPTATNRELPTANRQPLCNRSCVLSMS